MKLICGELSYDPPRRLLLRGNVAVHVSPKALTLLEILLAERPRVVPKQELQASVWGDVIVEEANLTNLVSELRAALGDDSRQPRYVRTVHGYGYGFIGELSETEDAPAPGAPPSRPRRWLLGLAALLLLLLMIPLLRLSTHEASVGSGERELSGWDAPVVVIPVTTAENLSWATVSPDRRFLAYSTEGVSEKAIRLRHLESGSEVELVAGENVYRLSRLRFSHDGNFLYYLHRPEGGGRTSLRRVSVLGGPVETIVAGRASVTIEGFDLSPDGVQIVHTARDTALDATKVLITDRNGSPIRELASITPAGLLSQSISWSPDGKSVVIMVEYADYELVLDSRLKWNLLAIDVETGEQHSFSSRAQHHLYSIEWLAEGQGLISATCDGRIAHVSHPTGHARTLRDLSGRHFEWIGPAGESELFAVTIEPRIDLWTVDLDRDSASRITFVGRNSNGFFGLAWTPDERIVFTAGRYRGSQALWISDADGRHQRQLTKPPTRRTWHFQPVVSPDGRWIVFTERRFAPGGFSSQLIRIELSGAGWTPLTPPGRISERPSITADGEWVVYTLLEPDGMPRAMKVPLAGGEPVALPVDRPCLTGAVDRSGLLLACSNHQRQEYVVSLDGRPLWQGDPPVRDAVRFTPGQSLSYVALAGDSVGNVWIQDLDRSAPRKLTSFTSERLFNHAWHPTSNRLVVARGELGYDAVMISSIPKFEERNRQPSRRAAVRQ